MRRLWPLVIIFVLFLGSSRTSSACSSFAVYGGPEPVFGMNWDLVDNFEPTFAIRLVEGTKVFQMQLEEYDYFLFYNEHGLLGNLQQSVPRTTLRGWRHQELVDITEIFKAAKSMETVKDVAKYISDRRIMDRDGNHSLYADLSTAMIVEPGETGNHLILMEEKYALMTNFPIHFFFDYSDERMDAFTTREGRYKAGSTLIKENLDTFDLEDAFRVLEAMTQPITRFSFVVLPERNLVFLTLGRNFSRMWLIDLSEMTIETYRGFAEHKIEDLGHHGITLSELRTWE